MVSCCTSDHLSVVTTLTIDVAGSKPDEIIGNTRFIEKCDINWSDVQFVETYKQNIDNCISHRLSNVSINIDQVTEDCAHRFIDEYSECLINAIHDAVNISKINAC